VREEDSFLVARRGPLNFKGTLLPSGRSGACERPPPVLTARAAICAQANDDPRTRRFQAGDRYPRSCSPVSCESSASRLLENRRTEFTALPTLSRHFWLSAVGQSRDFNSHHSIRLAYIFIDAKVP